MGEFQSLCLLGDEMLHVHLVEVDSCWRRREEKKSMTSTCCCSPLRKNYLNLVQLQPNNRKSLLVH